MNAVTKQIDEGFHAELLESVGRHRYRLWFRDTVVQDVSEHELTLAVPTEVHRTWLQFTYGDLLSRACERVLGPGTCVSLEVSALQDTKRVFRDRIPERPEDWSALLDERRPTPTLEGYVVGRGGRFPVMLLGELLKGSVGGGPPVVYLFGPSGSGKTHLLRALERGALRRSPGECLYLTIRQFTERYVGAVRGRDVSALRAFRGDLSGRRLVVLDGIEQLGGRPSTQRELVSLLDTVRGTPTRVVMAGVGHPAELEGLSAKLRSRLLGGVVARLQAPRGDALQDVLRARAASMGVELTRAVGSAIAERTSSTQGSIDLLDRWAALSAKLGHPLDAECLSEIAPGAAACATEEVIRRTKDLVARHYGVQRGLLDQPTKVRSAAVPRRMAMYLVYRACALPLVKLGDAFGLKSHSSVSRAIQEIRELRETDVEIEQTIDGLLAEI